MVILLENCDLLISQQLSWLFFQIYFNSLNYCLLVSEEEISREAADMEMKQEKYVEELKKVLLFDQEFSDTYRFDISKKEINGESIHFSYEKNLKDVTVSIALLHLFIHFYVIKSTFDVKSSGTMDT